MYKYETDTIYIYIFMKLILLEQKILFIETFARL